jgi:UDPglucose 6-dehydrogenase
LIKHAANAFLATKISFINMVAHLCERVGEDVSLVAEGIGLDHPIGPHYLQAGLGFGGSCFPEDIKAFFRIAEDLGVDFGLLREVEQINAARVTRLLRTCTRACGCSGTRPWPCSASPSRPIRMISAVRPARA